MNLSATPSSADSLLKAYQEFDRNLRVRQAKVAAVLALVLMPAGFTLDYFVYPSLVKFLFELRLACDVALIPPFLILFTRWARRYIHLLDKAPAILPTICMCCMILASEGTVSPYYAGLNLVITAVCLLFCYTLWEGVAICSFSLVCYTGACLVHGLIVNAGMHRAGMVTDASTLVNNLYFLVLNSIIAVTATRFNSKRRFEDFRLRHELAANNTELAATLKKLQETEVQLVQSEKMNALGKLSAGLLHEVNNPLNFTFMALQIAEQEAEGNESLQDTLKDIGQGMSRIRGVISDLRAFAYPTKENQQESFSVDEALTSALRLTAHELGEIPVERENVSTTVLGGKSQIVHVLMNLLVNSAHALKKKAGPASKIKVSCAVQNTRLRVCVRDNGSGVKPADLPRLLEPFFTTKDVGEGMGLGLSICHTIVKNHGGNIDITSQEGEWTEVSFDLPLKPTKDVSAFDAEPAFTEEPAELVGSSA